MNRETTRVITQNGSSFKSPSQLALFLITQALGLIITIMTFAWLGSYRGFDWNGHGKYSWHPTLMILGTVYFFGTALCAFRLMPFERYTIKMTHLVVNVLVVISMAIAFGVIVSLRSNANVEHFVSLHSWIGLITIIIMFAQLPISIVVYGLQWSSASLRAALMPWHRKSGVLIFLLNVAANLTGYQTHMKTKNPGEKVLVNVMGMLLLLFTIMILFINTEKRFKFNKR